MVPFLIGKMTWTSSTHTTPVSLPWWIVNLDYKLFNKCLSLTSTANCKSLKMDQIQHKYIHIRGVKLHVAELGTGAWDSSLLIYFYHLKKCSNFHWLYRSESGSIYSWVSRGLVFMEASNDSLGRRRFPHNSTWFKRIWVIWTPPSTWKRIFQWLRWRYACHSWLFTDWQGGVFFHWCKDLVVVWNSETKWKFLSMTGFSCWERFWIMACVSAIYSSSKKGFWDCFIGCAFLCSSA